MTDANKSIATPADESPKGRAFGQAYWMCNSIEMFERLAYFGIRSVVPIYIMQATEPGGLHLTAVHKGWIYMWWAILQSWLPMFTGGIADRYGYKRVLVGAISTNVIGYVMMAYLTSYYGFFAGILVLATGTAFFKPALQGSIAQNLTKATSSLGWGIFYWVVNVGAVCAPVLATLILGRPHSAQGWQTLFLASAAYTCVNLLLLLTFKDVPSGADKSMGLHKVFLRTIENIWPYWFHGGRFVTRRWVPGVVMFSAGLYLLILKPFASTGWPITPLGWVLFLAGVWLLTWLFGGKLTWQLRLPAFLLIMSCFWMMMYQLWDLHPNFIEDWVDSSSVTAISAFLGFDSWIEYGDRGLIRVPQQILLNLNAFLIVALIVPISWLVRKMRTLSAMLIGMSVATGGILVAGLTGNGWILLLGIVLFSLGEMLTGPKKNEYLSLIAPPGKKGLYLGYVNIPIGIGVGFGSFIAGVVYDSYGEKATLSLKYFGTDIGLLARAAQSADWSDSLELIPGLLDVDRDGALDIACEELRQDPDTAASTLRDAFRYDTGQITNLGLAQLALHPELKPVATKGLAELLMSDEKNQQAQELGKRLSSGELKLEAAGIARFVHLLPGALGINRAQVFEILRDRAEHEAPGGEAMADQAIVDMLWERFGHDPETLNNLALEYLAQGTPRMRKAVASMTFEDPKKDIKERLGIGRTKSFAALGAAMGADYEVVERALSEMPVDSNRPEDRAYAYLMSKAHQRFLAVARKDWTKDVALLRTLIESDPAVMEVVLGDIDKTSWQSRLFSRVSSLFGGGEEVEKTLAQRLAPKQDLIQKALAKMDWSKAPDKAALLLGLNPFEARALAAAEVNRSLVTATKLLWDKYHPQYKVWLPFAAIGVVAAIALAIFGQMAKRWSDMNA